MILVPGDALVLWRCFGYLVPRGYFGYLVPRECFGSLEMLWLFASLEMLWLFASLGIPCLFGPLGMLWLFGSLGGALRLKYIRKGNITTLLQNCDPISGRLVAVLYL